MTPEAEKKGKELIEKFKPYAIGAAYDNEEWHNNAKACALICVEEILQDHKNNAYLEDWKPNLINYWQEVKQFLKQ